MTEICKKASEELETDLLGAREMLDDSFKLRLMVLGTKAGEKPNQCTSALSLPAKG